MARNRAVVDSNGESYQVWVAGGRIDSVVLTAGVWTQIVPTAGIDVYLVETDPVGRVVRTSTATFADLVDGAAVTPAHLERAMGVYPGQEPFGIDADAPTSVFFTLVGVDAGTTLPVRIEGACA